MTKINTFTQSLDQVFLVKELEAKTFEGISLLPLDNTSLVESGTINPSSNPSELATQLATKAIHIDNPDKKDGIVDDDGTTRLQDVYISRTLQFTVNE